MEFYVRANDEDSNVCWLDSAWFNDEIGEWKVFIQSVDELVELSRTYGEFVVREPADDFECPSLELYEDS